MEPESRRPQALTTWDGMPVSQEAPRGATIVVFRRHPDGPELLMLHRAHRGADYDGDWAWTPPAGARFPGEPIAACAWRELLEETGLELDLELTDCGTKDWWVYLTEAPEDASVMLDREHDQYAWLPCRTALARCRPRRASEPLEAAVRRIERACSRIRNETDPPDVAASFDRARASIPGA
jgi:8-oxo-dGTP pyrophosphatase MutT (NUDIX family)